MPRAIKIGTGVAGPADRQQRFERSRAALGQFRCTRRFRTPGDPGARKACFVSGVQRSRGQHDQLTIADRPVGGQVTKPHRAHGGCGKADRFRGWIRCPENGNTLVVDAEQVTLGSSGLQRIHHCCQRGLGKCCSDIQAGDFVGSLEPSGGLQYGCGVDDFGSSDVVDDERGEHRCEPIGAHACRRA